MTQEINPKEETLQPLDKLLRQMAEHYGLQAGEGESFDPAQLLEAFHAEHRESDQAKNHYEQELGKLRCFCGELVKLVEQEKKGRKADRLYERWSREAEALQEDYPDFSLKKELETPKFRELLRAVPDLRSAYELCHREELLRALREAEGQKLRPRENGMGEQGAAAMQTDISRLSKAQRQEIIRRVRQGETIRF